MITTASPDVGRGARARSRRSTTRGAWFRARASAGRRAARIRRPAARRRDGGGGALVWRARSARHAAARRSRRRRAAADATRASVRRSVVVIAPAQGARPVAAANAVASSRKKSSVKRPGCRSGERCQPRNASRHAIQRRPAKRLRIVPSRVVQAAAVAVDEPAAGLGDQLAERRHPVSERQPAITSLSRRSRRPRPCRRPRPRSRR